jgi:hypothetical protein
MKKQLAVLGFTAATVLSGVAIGATVFTPTLVGAQEATEETTETECARPHRGLRGPGLTVAAETIGITEDALREALEGGQTLAEVAAANGVDVQTVIDAMVADVAAHLAEKVEAGDITQEQADARIERVTETITARANGEEPARPERRPAPAAEEDAA